MAGCNAGVIYGKMSPDIHTDYEEKKDST